MTTSIPTLALGEDDIIFKCTPNNNNYIWLDSVWLSFMGANARDLNQSGIIEFVEFSTNPTGGNVGTVRLFEGGDDIAGLSQWQSIPSGGWSTAGVEAGTRIGQMPFNIAYGFHWSAKRAGKSLLISEAWTGFGVIFRGPPGFPSMKMDAGCTWREMKT